MSIKSNTAELVTDSDIQDIWHQEVVKFINENPSVYDPRKVIMSGQSAMKEFIAHKINLLKEEK